jgi:hypothetical protein
MRPISSSACIGTQYSKACTIEPESHCLLLNIEPDILSIYAPWIASLVMAVTVSFDLGSYIQLDRLSTGACSRIQHFQNQCSQSRDTLVSKLAIPRRRISLVNKLGDRDKYL